MYLDAYDLHLVFAKLQIFKLAQERCYKFSDACVIFKNMFN